MLQLFYLLFVLGAVVMSAAKRFWVGVLVGVVVIYTSVGEVAYHLARLDLPVIGWLLATGPIGALGALSIDVGLPWVAWAASRSGSGDRRTRLKEPGELFVASSLIMVLGILFTLVWTGLA